MLLPLDVCVSHIVLLAVDGISGARQEEGCGERHLFISVVSVCARCGPRPSLILSG